MLDPYVGKVAQGFLVMVSFFLEGVLLLAVVEYAHGESPNIAAPFRRCKCAVCWGRRTGYMALPIWRFLPSIVF